MVLIYKECFIIYMFFYFNERLNFEGFWYCLVEEKCVLIMSFDKCFLYNVY